MWRRSVLHAAECAMLLGQLECAGRLLRAASPVEATEAAARAEEAARAVLAAALVMMRRSRARRDLMPLAEAAELVRRAALAARVDALLAVTTRAA
jgi:hypothetical protein